MSEMPAADTAATTAVAASLCRGAYARITSTPRTSDEAPRCDPKQPYLFGNRRRTRFSVPDSKSTDSAIVCITFTTKLSRVKLSDAAAAASGRSLRENDQLRVGDSPLQRRKSRVRRSLLRGQMFGSRSKYSSSSFEPPSPLPSCFSDSTNSIRSIHLIIL